MVDNEIKWLKKASHVNNIFVSSAKHVDTMEERKKLW